MFFVYHGTCLDAYIGSETFDLTGNQSTAIAQLPSRPVTSKSIPQILVHKLPTFFQFRVTEFRGICPSLVLLDDQQFDELCVDVYYELVRRETSILHRNVSGVSHKDELDLNSNHACQNLGWLPANLFDGLARDIYSELCARYPWLSWNRDLYTPGYTFGEPALSRIPFDENHSQVVDDALVLHDNFSQYYSTENMKPHATSGDHEQCTREGPNGLLSIDDSLGYLDALMNSFETTPEVYNAFWRLVGEFKSQSIDMSHLIQDVVNLFTNRPTYFKEVNTRKTRERDYAEHIRNPHSMAPPGPFSRQSTLCLDGHIARRSEHVVASGGSADIWTGSLGGQTVAIKTMRAFSSMGTPIQKAKLLKRIWREYLAWSRLSHPNVIECLGFSYDFAPQAEMPSLISPWMSNGTVLSYIDLHPDTNRLKLVIGVGKALCYLHTREPAIVHGDLRAGNILVSNAGDPCLTDFGLSRILDDTGVTTSSSEPGAGSLRWMAPELFNGDERSQKSDVWAYGMTILEIFSGKRPYHELHLEPAVFHQIIDGHIPSRPLHDAHLTDNLWSLCQKCWRVQSTQRPSMRQVMADLAGTS